MARRRFFRYETSSICYIYCLDSKKNFCSIKYGFIILNIQQLLDREKLADSRMARRIQEYMAEDRPVPNDLMVQIINSRLEEEDCVKHGWILFFISLIKFPKDVFWDKSMLYEFGQ